MLRLSKMQVEEERKYQVEVKKSAIQSEVPANRSR